MKKSLISTIFWSLVVVFLFIISQFLIPSVRDLISGSEIFLTSFAVFFALGVILIFLTIKEKTKGLLKIFLLLIGISAVGFFVSVILHNAFYALGTVTGHIFILGYLTQTLGAVFFLIAVFVCPLSFLIGLIGGIVLFIKKDKR